MGVAGVDDPHLGMETLSAGAYVENAVAAVILLHGRGGQAQSMLSLADELTRPGFLFLAPQARDRAWYPNSFRTAVEGNQPWLDSALAVIARLLAQLAASGLPAERVALLGFSQGACLALEYAARNPRRYGAVFGLSGGLIGEQVDPAGYSGNLQGTPVLLACSQQDPYIPLPRVHQTEQVMTALGAAVELREYPGSEHNINEDELARIWEMLALMLNASGKAGSGS